MIRSSSGSKTSLSEGFEASVIYVRFKAAASEVFALMFSILLVIDKFIAMCFS